MTYFYHSVLDSPHLPRDLETESAPNLLMLLLGEFWRYTPHLAVPSAALVELLEPVGVSPIATRAALSRLSRKGTLVVTRTGRTTAYSLAPEVAATVPISERLTMSFAETDRAWDGEWTVVIFSLSEQERVRRAQLRDWLRWLGFGPARDGVWVSPHADVSLTQRTLADLLPADGLIFKSAHIAGELSPGEVWPLEEIRAVYEGFIADARKTVYRLREGTVAPSEALRIALVILGRWRGFPTVDPDLPAQYLPPDWPRREARRLFVAVFDGCVPLANEYVRQVLVAYGDDLAAAAGALSVDEALAHYSIAADKDHADIRAQASRNILHSGLAAP